MEFQYCYLVHSDDELYHYGVKGMHWGIRRYQPYTINPRKRGSGVYKPTTTVGKKGKAELWKAKESQRQASRYDRKEAVIDTYISKQKSKLKMAKAKNASDEKIAKINKKIDYGETEKRINEKLKTAELKNLAKMSMKDVSSARLKKGMHYAGKVLKSTAVKAATMAAIGGSAALIDASRKQANFASKQSTKAVKNWIIEQNLDNDVKNHANASLNYARNGEFGLAKAERLAREHAWASRVEASLARANASGLAHKAQVVSSALKAAGFGLGATAGGVAIQNFRKLGRINEYSSLSRDQRKRIEKAEKNAFKKRYEKK